MYETTIDVCDDQVFLTGEWVGEKDSDWADSRAGTSAQHNIITVECNGIEQEFDFWGSIMSPAVDTEYDLLNAFHSICSDAWYIYNSEEDEITSGLSYQEGVRVVESCTETLRKLESLGLGDEQHLLEVLNNEDWQ